MLLKAHDETRRAPDPKAALEMALIRLCYVADLPGPEEALKALRDGAPVGGPAPSSGGSGGGGGGGATARQLSPQAVAAPRAQTPAPQSFEEVVALIDAKRDISLKLDVERFVRPIHFRRRPARR
jgi:DNA polymerase-3 subunit gamma/tau